MTFTVFLIALGILFLLTYIDCAPFQVNVETDGSYTILVNDDVWLTSGDTAFNVDGRTYSTVDGSLVLIASTTANGTDELASWTSTSFIYLAGLHPVNTTIKRYTDPKVPAAVFTQTYLGHFNKTSAGSSDKVISKFPSFKLGAVTVDLGYLAFAGEMVGYNFSTGRFNEDADFEAGLGGGPLVIFDKTSNAVVISPLSQFMAASVSLDSSQQVNWGILGLVNEVPEKYSVDFIIYYNNQGINQAIKSWGNYLTTFYHKSPDRRDNDLTVQYLGYWTDNGAYYYYNTEKNKTYEKTILDTVDYINSLHIPFKYLQFDSWWYLKGKHNGTISWLPESSVFPDGFKYLYEKTRLPISLHNKFWDNETTYAKYNGGPYNFIQDRKSGLALPIDSTFWHDVFNRTQTWGKFLLYEQDWMAQQTEKIRVLQNDLFIGQEWLSLMGQGAEEFGINIQYCTSYPRHMFQSLLLPAVTQARVSKDYKPGGRQWNIGVTSIFADALNIAPYKDTFLSTESQPGNPYNKTEPNTRLQALISTLSTGPVGPGDGIGYMNKELIMKSCDSSGLLLKPAKPATAIDDQIKRSAFGSGYSGPVGEVYTTYTIISGFLFGIILAADVTNEYNLRPAGAWPSLQFPPSLAFSARDPKTLFIFADEFPISLSSFCSDNDFCLYYTSPLLKLNSGEAFVVLGELEKWVPVSPQRFSDIQATGTDFLIGLRVQAKEAVNVTYYDFTHNEAKSVVCNNSKSSDPAFNSIISLVKETCILS